MDELRLRLDGEITFIPKKHVDLITIGSDGNITLQFQPTNCIPHMLANTHSSIEVKQVEIRHNGVLHDTVIHYNTITIPHKTIRQYNSSVDCYELF